MFTATVPIVLFPTVKVNLQGRDIKYGIKLFIYVLQQRLWCIYQWGFAIKSCHVTHK